MFAAQRRARTAAVVARYETSVAVITRGLFLERTAHRVGQPLLLAAQAMDRFDATVPAALTDAAAAGTMLAASSMSRLRAVRINVYIAGSVLVAGVLTLLALLAATGHFWVHTV
jgi:hypothetical protein